MNKLLILSDLHLGNGGPYDIFAGHDALPMLLANARADTVVLNGDTVDFLLDDDPLSVDPAATEKRARAIVDNPALDRVWGALTGHLAAGGELMIRPGNHDIELALPAVQAVLRSRLQPHGERVRFVSARTPLRLEVGGQGVAIAHGEADDPWNRIDWQTLEDAPAAFRYPPGSQLVKHILNPAKRTYGMRFADLLKPDVAGAALTAVAVRPDIPRVLGNRDVWRMLKQLGTRTLLDQPYGAMAGGAAPAGAEPSRELDGLGPHDQSDLNTLLDGGELPRGALGDDFLPAVLRGAMTVFCSAWRTLAGADAAACFSLAPGDEEWRHADELGNLQRSPIVVFGHTHAARFRRFGGLTYLNTGTWIPLMRLPAPEEPLDRWADLLADLRADPGLTGRAARRLEHRFTAAVVEARDGGARAALLSVSGGDIVELQSE